MNARLLALPLELLGAGAVAVYLLARLVSRRNEFLAVGTVLVLLAALAAMVPVLRAAIAMAPVTPGGSMETPLLAEPGGTLIALTALGLGVIVALYSGRYLALDRRSDRYYPLLLLMLTGTVGVTLAADLFTLYLFLVLTNASSYVLVAFRRDTETSIEAGYKYAILGTMGSIVFLAGIGLVLRSTGSLSLPMAGGPPDAWGLLGIAFITFGLLLKSAVFPAHTWLPDAHGRAPSSISALLSGIIVPVQIYTLVKVGVGLGAPRPGFGWLLVGLGCCSLVTGNVLALRQEYGKRLLGYSTVAQVGYMCLAFGLGLALERPEPLAAGMLLLVGHALLKGLAFLAKGVLHFYYGTTTLGDLNGIARRAPLASGLFAIALVGLSGMPPLPGFVGKFGLLWAIVGLEHGGALAVGALYLLGTLVSLGYYLPLVGRLLHRATQPADAQRHSLWMQAPLVMLAGSALLLGVWPGPVWRLAMQAAQFLSTWGGG